MHAFIFVPVRQFLFRPGQPHVPPDSPVSVDGRFTVSGQGVEMRHRWPSVHTGCILEVASSENINP